MTTYQTVHHNCHFPRTSWYCDNRDTFTKASKGEHFSGSYVSVFVLLLLVSFLGKSKVLTVRMLTVVDHQHKEYQKYATCDT